MLRRFRLNCLYAAYFLLCVGGGMGCDFPNPARQELVQALRILAIRAEPPAVTPGTTIRFTALVASPYIPAIQLRWFACKSPSQAAEGCADKADATPLGQGESAEYQVPKDFIPSDASTIEKYAGRYLPITLVAKAGPFEEVSTKRVVVTLLPMNQNPKLKGVKVFQGQQATPLSAPWQVGAGSSCKIEPELEPTSREKYLTLDTSGKIHEVQEEPILSWYITGGTLQGGRMSDHQNPSKVWVTPKELPSESQNKATVYIILRDGRGGVDWSQQVLTFR